MHLLLIDDDLIFLRLIERQVLRIGHSIDTASSTREVRALLLARKPDLMLVDLGLPGVVGFSFVESLAVEAPGIPFAIVTGQHDAGRAVEMMRHGALDYLVKDENLHDRLPAALARIEEHLIRHRQLEASEAARLESEARRMLLMRELLDISELERLHFGRELHDGLGQQMAGLNVLAHLHANSLRQEKSGRAAQADKISQGIAEALRQARTLAHGLAPLSIAKGGIISALGLLSQQIADSFPVRCQFACSQDCPDVTGPDVVLHLYRIAQEASSNAFRHGQAHEVSLSLAFEPPVHVLTIKDDGKGFSLTGSGDGHGLGLRTMQHRAQVIGAALQITSAPGGGTVICCRLPAEPSPPAHPT